MSDVRRRKPGRPANPNGRLYPASIRLELSAEQLATLTQAASHAEVSRNAFIRHAAIQRAKRLLSNASDNSAE